MCGYRSEISTILAASSLIFFKSACTCFDSSFTALPCLPPNCRPLPLYTTAQLRQKLSRREDPTRVGCRISINIKYEKTTQQLQTTINVPIIFTTNSVAMILLYICTYLCPRPEKTKLSSEQPWCYTWPLRASISPVPKSNTFWNPCFLLCMYDSVEVHTLAINC